MGKSSLEIYTLSMVFLSWYLPKISKVILWEIIGIDWNKNIIVISIVITSMIAVAYSILLLKIVDIFKKVGFHSILYGK